MRERMPRHPGLKSDKTRRASGSGHFRNLGLAIRILRELKGFSQAQLARKAGVGKSQLSKYENGKELPKLDSLDRILVSLDASPFSLLLVADSLSRLEGEGPSDLLWLGAPLGPLLSDSEEDAFTALMRSVFGLFQARSRSRLRMSLGLAEGSDEPITDATASVPPPRR